jgi:hypothetical protein
MRILLLAVALAACGPSSGVSPTDTQVTLLLTFADCNGTSVLGDTSQYRVVIWSGAMVDSDKTTRASDGLPKELTFPAGVEKRLEIQALDSNGNLVAVARTGTQKFEPGAATWALAFRAVNAFTPVCRKMIHARAGHAAAVLDGNIAWLAGGVAGGTALSTVERLDLAAGIFSTGNELSVSMQRIPRAFGSTTPLENGQIVLWGGETTMSSPSSIVMVYDPPTDAFGVLIPRKPPAPANIPRSRHFAARVGSEVVILGGVNRTGPVADIERFDIATLESRVDAQLPVPRTDAAIAAFDGTRIVIAGGREAPERIDVVGFSTTVSVAVGTLQTPRHSAAAATHLKGVLVLGGEDTQGATLGSSELVAANGSVTPGPAIAARSEACAATLLDGSVLVVGGRVNAVPSAAVERIQPSLQVDSLTFPGPARLHASCTTLADGSVLIAGGTGATGELDDAWIFTPR